MEDLGVEEEEEDLVEVVLKLIATDVDNKDTMQGTVPTLPQYVSIENPMTMLLKTALIYKISGRKRDCSWETRMSSLLVLRIALYIKTLMSSREVD